MGDRNPRAYTFLIIQAMDETGNGFKRAERSKTLTRMVTTSLQKTIGSGRTGRL